MAGAPGDRTGHVRSLVSSQWERWTSSYSDIGINCFSLKFKDPGLEAGFATSMAARLTSRYISIGGVGVCLIGAHTINKYCIAEEPDDYTGVLEDEVDSAVRFAMAGIISLALIALGLGLLQYRCSVFGPRTLETIAVSGVLICFMYPITVDERFITKVAGRPQDWEAGDYIALWLDSLITVLSLAPIRWNSSWMVYVAALFWYDVSHFLFFAHLDKDKPHLPVVNNISGTLMMLIVCAMVGKRGHEIKERELFRTVVTERTKRAETEFILEQHGTVAKSTRTLTTSHTPSSLAPSKNTEKIFEGGIAHGNLKLALANIKVVAAKEQWLVDPKELCMDTSRVLGSGGSGVVFVGSYRDRSVAVKMSLELTAESMSTCATELRILRKLEHPNIVRFYGALIDPGQQALALVLEIIRGNNLDDFVKRFRAFGMHLPDMDSYSISHGLAQALRYLHSQCPAIVHGDMKPANVLLELSDSLPPQARLSDFGLSRILSGGMRDLGGTLVWMAPELAQGNVAPNTAVDTYGLGRMLLFTLSSQSPFAGWRRQMILTALQSGYVNAPEYPEDPSELTATLWKLALECIAANPLDRPTVAIVCEQLEHLSVTLGGLMTEPRLSNCEFSKDHLDVDGHGIGESGRHGPQNCIASDGPLFPTDKTFLASHESLMPWSSALDHLKSSLGRPAPEMSAQPEASPYSTSQAAGSNEQKMVWRATRHDTAPSGSRTGIMPL